MRTRISGLLSFFAFICAFFPLPAHAQLSAIWEQKNPLPGPSQRGWVDTIYDSVIGEHALFGGSGGLYFNDVWTYSLAENRWVRLEDNVNITTELSPPCRRDEHSVEFDARNRLYFSFGGTGFNCGQIESVTGAGTTTTTIVDPSLTATTDNFYVGWRIEAKIPSGTGRGWVVAYEAATKRLTLDAAIGQLSPGRTFWISPQSGGGMWSYNPVTREWRGYDSPIWGYTGPKPPSRYAPAFTASPNDDAIVLFGGGNSVEVNDTWVFHTDTLTWEQKRPDGDPASPPRRVEITNSMTYDSHNQVFILHGGQCREPAGSPRCNYNDLLTDTWAYRLSDNTWTNMSPPQFPSKRSQQQMAYDPVNRVVVLYGGRIGDTDLYDDIWVYSYTANTWTQVQVNGPTPGGRALGAMSYDPNLGRFVQFGGWAKVNGVLTSTSTVWTLHLFDQGTNQPPQVSLTSPTDGATFTAPANVAFSASASDPGGSVSKVEYFNGASRIFESTLPPYNFTWTNVPLGNYVLTAKATDNLGATTVSAPINISVTGGGGNTYQISGSVANVAAPLGGVTFAGGNGVACNVSDAAGQYSCTVPQGYTGSITPALSGYSFTPPARSYSNVNADQSAQDYAAALNLDVVWVEDAIPAGGTPGGNEAWNWVSNNPVPFSGTLAHRSDIVAGMHQHHFNNATATLSVGAGDTLFAYVYLDPANPPSQVMLQWNDGTWEHRAYWGTNLIGWGTPGTASLRNMGSLPALGQWVRLEVPASQVGLEGRTLVGMAFTLFNGRATWDRVGKSSAAALPGFTVSGTVLVNGTPLNGVSFSGGNGASCNPSNAAGKYSCTVPQGYIGSITPTLSGYTFTPPSRGYSNVIANQDAQDYTATISTTLTFIVSGMVSENGTPLSGVGILGGNGEACGSTNVMGQYNCTVPQGYTGSITPALSGYSFTPPSRSYSNVNADQGAQDYAAALNLDVVWVEDAIPAGGTPGGNEAWNWVSSNPAPFSGTLAHRTDIVAGMHQHHFNNATAALNVGAGDTLFAYVYLDPANPPGQVMLQWNDGTWEHRAYWGTNLIGWGTQGTASLRNMGSLPALGQWVRLEVPASQVGLENRVVRGMAFTLFNGRATWDRAGKR